MQAGLFASDDTLHVHFHNHDHVYSVRVDISSNHLRLRILLSPHHHEIRRKDRDRLDTPSALINDSNTWEPPEQKHMQHTVLCLAT